MRFRSLTIAISGLMGCGLTAVAPAAPEPQLAVAAAADLKFAFEPLVEAFQSEHPGTAVKPSFGSSGTFYSQLSNGAPYDLFFSADAEYPRRLLQEGLGLEGSEFLYAIGRIVVFVPNSSSISLQSLGMKALGVDSVRHISIANPQHAPYGRAAVAAMKTAGIYDSVKDRLVFGENVAQAAQFVESGSAEAGIIALSLAIAPAMKDAGRFWEIPVDSYPRIEQGGVILKSSRNAAAAGLFRTFVLGAQGRAILKRYGFFLPER